MAWALLFRNRRNNLECCVERSCLAGNPSPGDLSSHGRREIPLPTYGTKTDAYQKNLLSSFLASCSSDFVHITWCQPELLVYHPPWWSHVPFHPWLPLKLPARPENIRLAERVYVYTLSASMWRESLISMTVLTVVGQTVQLWQLGCLCYASLWRPNDRRFQ
jgi:hypothetical protein